MIQEIESIIKQAIPDAIVMVKNPYNDGEHFEAYVVSKSFEGTSLVNQQKKVMSPLKEAFASKVHALALRTFTPEKWDQFLQTLS